MKRDMEMIRQILSDVEAHDSTADCLKASDPHVAYQVFLMKDAGLVDAEIIQNHIGFPAQAAILGLTWAGHDFLDAARDNKIWKKAMDHIIKPGASWTFGLLLEWLKQEARQKIFGLPPDAGN